LALGIRYQRLQQRHLAIRLVQEGRITRIGTQPQLGFGVGGGHRSTSELRDGGP
jgi:hypothetical protein